jgi:hypothetical protein
MLETSQASDEATVQSRMALSAVEITPEMIRAGVEILETSSFCETSPAIAEGLAGDVTRSALAVARDQSKNRSSYR